MTAESCTAVLPNSHPNARAKLTSFHIRALEWLADGNGPTNLGLETLAGKRRQYWFDRDKRAAWAPSNVRSIIILIGNTPASYWLKSAKSILSGEHSDRLFPIFSTRFLADEPAFIHLQERSLVIVLPNRKLVVKLADSRRADSVRELEREIELSRRQAPLKLPIIDGSSSGLHPYIILPYLNDRWRIRTRHRLASLVRQDLFATKMVSTYSCFGFEHVSIEEWYYNMGGWLGNSDLPPHIRNSANVLRDRVREFAREEGVKSFPSTTLHGDLWTGHVWWKADREVRLLDWGRSIDGNVFHDLYNLERMYPSRYRGFDPTIPSEELIEEICLQALPNFSKALIEALGRRLTPQEIMMHLLICCVDQLRREISFSSGTSGLTRATERLLHAAV